MSTTTHHDGRAPSAITEQATTKGFRLHHCVPLTDASRECWMVQRGSSLRFLESFDALQAAVAEMDEHHPLSHAASVKEAALRAALDELNDEVGHG